MTEENDEIYDLVEKGHTFVIGDNTTIVWQTQHYPPQEFIEEVVKNLSEKMPTAEHLIVPDLEDVYVVHDEKVESKGEN